MRSIEAVPGYLIFFDDNRVDQFVKSFSVDMSISGGMGRAAIDMLYLPELSDIESRSISESDKGALLSIIDSIDNMTNVKIFIKNIFNNRYCMVFDGNLRSKSVTKTPSGNSLTYGAIDYTAWLTQTMAPMAIPVNDILAPSDRFRWYAQGIEVENVERIQTTAALNFKGKTLREVFDLVSTQALKANALYSNPSGVGYWDGILKRIDIMGDIDPRIRNAGIFDLAINPEVLSADSVYVLLNDILSKLMFEFFQDRDGVVRIKPPFWNEPVLLNHVIDASLIYNITERTDWSNLKTRVITVGGLDDYQRSPNPGSYAEKIQTPIGAYLGNGQWSNSATGGTGLLSPTPMELKYGPSIAETVQPMIKFSAIAALTDGDAMQALRSYSEFLFNMLNSMVKTANIDCVGMPWIRPGFNVWVDPLGTDKVYYVQGVSHSGNPQSGVNTSLSLVHGRTRSDFASGRKGVFGTMGSQDNMFVNTLLKGASHFGTVIRSQADFVTIRQNLSKFHKSGTPVVKAHRCMLTSLYGAPNNSPTVNSPTTGNQGASKNQVNLEAVPSFTILKRNSSGDSVVWLQTALSAVGHDAGSADGAFGPKTEAAVKAFQKAHSLTQDGIVGDKTKEALISAIKKAPKATASGSAPKTTVNVEPGTGVLADSKFTSDLSALEIEAKLQAAYQKAPGVVTQRSAKIRDSLQKGRKNAYKYYINAVYKRS